MNRRATWLLVGAATLLTPGVAAAQTSRSDEIKAIRAEIARLSARLDQLENRADATGPAAADEPAVPPASPAAQAPAAQAARPASYEIPPILLNDPQFALSESDIAALRSRTLVGGPLDRSLLPDGAGFELNATSDATSVAIKIARSHSVAGENSGEYETLALTASAPLNSSGRFSDLGTLDGFVGGSKLRFQLSWFERPISEPVDHPAFEALFDTVKAACRVRLGNDAKECKIDIDKDPLTSQFVHENAPELETVFLAMGRMTPGPGRHVDWSARAFGLEAAIGYKKFDFLEAGPVRKADASRVPLSGKLFYSYLPDVRTNSITGAVEYQRTFKDATAGALCPAVAPGIDLSCLTGPIGGPKRTEKLLLSGEYRHRIYFGEYDLIPAVGISGLVTYDALNDELGVDIPIYLVGDGKGGLSGGVRFGYTTSEKDFIAGVFVGTAFSLK